MNKYFLLALIFLTNATYAMDNNHGGHKHSDHHNSHQHKSDSGVDGSLVPLDEEMYREFVSNINGGQIAIIDVNGMVCDFCARGIEKTFSKDEMVKKIKVSLESGKVLIAYSDEKNISFEEIANIFLINGQTAVGFMLRKL
jgi:copper chaperone CopZ